MSDSGFHLFETPVGRCGIAWGPAGLLGLRLPESAGQASDRMARRFAGLAEAPPPDWVAEIVERIRRLLVGEPVDLADAALDLSRVGAFEASVYRLAQSIPPGSTLTYGEMADRLGDRLLARAVGQALGRNPWPIVVPCHRITGSDGRVGGFSAPGGTTTKRRLLEMEGAFAAEKLPLFAEKPA